MSLTTRKTTEKLNLTVLSKAEEILPSGQDFNDFEPLWENFQKLKPIQQQALSLLVMGESQTAIASKLGIERKSIYLWMQDDIFSRCYTLWQKKIFLEIDHQQKLVYQKALDALMVILNNPNDRDHLECIKLVLQNLKP